MIFSFDLLRARKGDCFLIHFGDPAKPGLVIVDGGPATVYGRHLKPRIDQIRVARALNDDQSLPVDLLMVSHADDDHIRGLLDLTREELTRIGPKLLDVRAFWHNSFDDVIDGEASDLTASMRSQFGEAAVSGDAELAEAAQIEVEVSYAEIKQDDDLEPVESGLKVLASIEQGYRLRLDAKKLKYPLNPHCDGAVIVADPSEGPVPIDQELTFHVLGPLPAEIAALRKKHQDWLKTLKSEGKQPPQALAAYLDKSVTNLSSIVALAEAGGKRMLLTGDARGDKILEGLEQAELMKDGRIHVDLLKAPHHGSSNNLEDDFFRKVTADHYVFSGDGEHGNPERESLEMLFDARQGEAFTLHFTYPIAEIDEGRAADWNKEQTKERKKATRRPERPTAVREDWDPERHGLKSLIDQRLVAGQLIEIVPPDGPHVIDLLDRISD